MHFLELIVSKMCLKGCEGVCSIFNSLVLLQRPSQEQCFEVTDRVHLPHCAAVMLEMLSFQL